MKRYLTMKLIYFSILWPGSIIKSIKVDKEEKEPFFSLPDTIHSP